MLGSEERFAIGVELGEQTEDEQRRQEQQTGAAATILAKDAPLAPRLSAHAQGEGHGYLGALSKLMRGSARISDTSASKLPRARSRLRKHAYTLPLDGGGLGWGCRPAERPYRVSPPHPSLPPQGGKGQNASAP